MEKVVQAIELMKERIKELDILISNEKEKSKIIKLNTERNGLINVLNQLNKL